MCLGLMGCEVSHDTSSKRCTRSTYDLTKPPTRAQVGMQTGKTTVVCESDTAFDVTLKLPRARRLDMAVTLLTFDSLGAAHAEVDDPTGADLHSERLPMERAVALGERIGHDLGIETAGIRDWRRRVEAGGDTDLSSAFMRSTVGYLTAELQVSHLASDNLNGVHVILSWK
jgi:hypothetical protein